MFRHFVEACVRCRRRVNHVLINGNRKASSIKLFLLIIFPTISLKTEITNTHVILYFCWHLGSIFVVSAS